MQRFYKLLQVDNSPPVWEVRWTVCPDSGRPYALRAFGPASHYACTAFLDFVEQQGMSHADARDAAIADAREMLA